MVKEEKPRRNWSRIVGIAIMLSMVVGLLAYMVVHMFILPLFTYEQLILWDFMGWTSNSKGEVKQATFTLFNNGTRRLTIGDFWVNGTLLDSTERLVDGALTLDPSGGIGPSDQDIAIVPKSFVFSVGASYNLTVGTASGNRYSFLIKCDEASVSPENLTFMEVNFVPGSPPHISVFYKNGGKTPLIITRVELNGARVDVPLDWLWPGNEHAISIENWWRHQSYTIKFYTFIGNTYEIAAHP